MIMEDLDQEATCHDGCQWICAGIMYSEEWITDDERKRCYVQHHCTYTEERVAGLYTWHSKSRSRFSCLRRKNWTRRHVHYITHWRDNHRYDVDDSARAANLRSKSCEALTDLLLPSASPVWYELTLNCWNHQYLISGCSTEKSPGELVKEWCHGGII